jgi:hypothetical protein
LNLDMLAFASLSDTAMRLHSREQFETSFRERLVAHDDGKEFQRHMKRLQKMAGSGGSDGDNLISDLTQLGAMK